MKMLFNAQDIVFEPSRAAELLNNCAIGCINIHKVN